MKILEKTLALLFTAGAILRALSIVGGGILLALSTLLFIIPYGLFSFALFNNISISQIFKKESYASIQKREVIFSCITGLMLYIGLLGVLFTIQSWKYELVQLFLGVCATLLSSIMNIILFLTTQNNIYKNMYSRTIFILITLVFMWFYKSL